MDIKFYMEEMKMNEYRCANCGREIDKEYYLENHELIANKRKFCSDTRCGFEYLKKISDRAQDLRKRYIERKEKSCF